jgi:uncharacterized membrane protein YgcG
MRATGIALGATALRLAVAILWLALSHAAVAEEAIESFASEIVVRADGILDVTETIRVRAEGDQIKRGIYRDFPLTFVDEGGTTRRVTFTLENVTRNGAPEPYHTNSNSQGVRIYAGTENVILDPGVYTYRIQYRTGRQIRFLPEQTELFWNVTGNEWVFPIQSATARIHLPDGAAPLRWTAYTGRFGERGKAFTGQILGDNTLEVATTAPLPPNSGLSVVVAIPDGVVAQPSGADRLTYWYLDNRRFLFGGLGFLGVLIFYLTAWSAVGRDPPKGIIIPRFHPPDGISPALAGYIREWGWRAAWREFTAAAISLAVKGALVFDDSQDKIVLSRAPGGLTVDSQALPPGERSILQWVDGRGGRIVIDVSNGKSLASALARFKSNIEGENRHRFFRRNLGYFILGLALTIGVMVIVLVFGNLTDGEIGLLIGTAFVGMFVGSVSVSIIRAIFRSRGVKLIVIGVINLAALAVMAAVILSIAAPVVRSLPDDFTEIALRGIFNNGFPFVLVGGLAVMNGLFYYLLRAPTAAGRKVMDEIEGLELYIRTAETARLNLAGAPDFTANHFERLLPYAIALKAEKPWSDAFQKAFAAAHPEGTAAATYQPAWHGGHGWGGTNLGRSIATAVSSAEGAFASAIPAPKSSSSGFSGGGGSGGGGGGGGGGGW